MGRNSMTVQTGALLLLALIFICWNAAGDVTGYDLTLTLSSTANEAAPDCCLMTVDRKISQNLVTSYYIQTPEMGCRVLATV
ncbi:hypothetical protein Baya_7894 [Bagarius yarrelli]|uniref:Chemokine interleukin-8-like domain-containing protein n=1 Tax=Bagarius yarrelli TaxID=175774 RepID=A0A556U2L5_BAGYA|nr:hypothetical protein Baya_7894 [Bagarius yarrelli]